VPTAKVLTRLRKLLALARSGNPHEASSARAKADEYMARHGLREEDASVEGEDEVVQVSIGSAGFASPWKFKLATVAARHHGCEALGLRVGKRRKVRLVGIRVGVTEAASLFKFLEQEVRRLAGAELRRVLAVFRRTSPSFARRLARKYVLRFAEGMVDGIAVSLAARRRGGGRRSPTPVDRSGVAAGDVAGVPVPRVEGLVRVEPRADGVGVRERLVCSGAREVSADDGGDFDDFDEVAYREGFGQAAWILVSGERRES